VNARELAARTPATRDRYVDFLRAASILMVVAGHWSVLLIVWENGIIWERNAIGVTPWLWLATWAFQVMPIFFFVGGFSNLVSLDSSRRRGISTWSWFRSRAVRLLKPSVIFLGFWAVVQVFLHLADVGAGTAFRIGDTWFLRGMLPPGAMIPFGPLWFLPVYLGIVALAPVTIRLHRRFGIGVPIAMVVGALLVDWIGFVVGIRGVRYVNILFVWLLPHQLGHFYGDGSLVRIGRRGYALMATAGLAGLILLTNPWIFAGNGADWFGGLASYPKSLIGTGREPVANTYPPTFVLVAQTFFAIGAVMLLRERLSPWLARVRVWASVVFVNSVIMTLFLWHMTAYLAAILLLWPLGLGREQTSTAAWWGQRPLWVLVPGAILVGIVAALGRYERPRPAPSPVTRGADRSAAAAAG
jgi:fucose 4-O-acetylase-like acetyltransferase